jgi:S-adenosylmethionine-dependent methyltransferase
VEITCVRADATNLPADIGAYDVVLCHNLLQYQPNPVPALKAAVNTLRPDGVLSVMAINRHAVPLVTAVRGTDPVAALAALDSTEAQTDTFGTTITLHTAEEITTALTDLGCRVVGHYGIRSVSDYIVDDARKHEPEFYADLERLELALTDRAPYQHTARIFQLVAVKAR